MPHSGRRHPDPQVRFHILLARRLTATTTGQRKMSARATALLTRGRAGACIQLALPTERKTQSRAATPHGDDLG